ncbi:MAG: CBS domain-containing protein [Actinomycetota bacterium]
MTTVQDVMREMTPTVGRSTPFKEVVQTMDAFRMSAVPVVDEEGRFVGMVTEADVLLKEAYGPAPEARVFERWRHRVELEKASGTTAGAIMRPAPTVTQATPVWEAAKVMHDDDQIRLPVVEPDGMLIGIVTWRDLLQDFLRTDEAIRREIVEGIARRGAVADPHAILVRVHGGIATIVGQVEHEAQIPLILDLVRDVEGVVEIEQLLTAPHEPDDQARRASSFAAGRPDR